MNKRGVLFYVIDAFIAAGIIAITIAIVFSLISSSQDPESVKEVVDNYLLFFEKTQFITAPGTVATSLLDNISDPRQPLLQGVGELLINGQSVDAENLVAEITSIILPSQFGVYFYFNGTSVYNRSTERIDSSKLLLTKQTSVVLASRAYVENAVYNFRGLQATGDDACKDLGFDECRFVVARCSDTISYELCSTDVTDYDLPLICPMSEIYDAQCSTFHNATIEGPYLVEVGVWS